MSEKHFCGSKITFWAWKCCFLYVSMFLKASRDLFVVSPFGSTSKNTLKAFRNISTYKNWHFQAQKVILLHQKSFSLTRFGVTQRADIENESNFEYHEKKRSYPFRMGPGSPWVASEQSDFVGAQPKIFKKLLKSHSKVTKSHFSATWHDSFEI